MDAESDSPKTYAIGPSRLLIFSIELSKLFLSSNVIKFLIVSISVLKLLTSVSKVIFSPLRELKLFSKFLRFFSVTLLVIITCLCSF